MSAVQTADAVVRDKGGVTWLDTRLMEWEPMPTLNGFFQKVLVRDPNGEPNVTLNYVPGFSPGSRPYNLPHRHMHHIREFAFVIVAAGIPYKFFSY